MGTLLAVETSKLDDVRYKQPALRRGIASLQTQIGQLEKETAKEEVAYSALRKSNLAYKRQIETDKGAVKQLKHEVEKATKRIAANQAELKATQDETLKQEEEATSLRGKIAELKKFKQQLSDKAASEKEDQESLEAQKAAAVTNLSPQQLESKEVKQTKELEKLKKEAAKAADEAKTTPTGSTEEMASWSWGA